MKSYDELRAEGHSHEFARAYVEGAERASAGLDRSPVQPVGPVPAEVRSFDGPPADTPAGYGHGTGLILPGATVPDPVDTDERRAAKRRFEQAHGRTDDWGVPTWAYYERVRLAEEYQANMHGRGANWVESRDVPAFLSRMKSGIIAAGAAQEATAFGPADEAARYAAIQARADALSGVESWTPPDALQRTAEAMHGQVWTGVHHTPPPFDAERGQ